MINIESPYRQRRAATIHINAPADDVFALMCPVREYEWEPGWTTNRIISASGLVEEGCIFTTPAGASEGSDANSAEALWTTPIHDPDMRRLMMIKFTPGECVTRLDIDVEAQVTGCSVDVAYEHTALSEAGRKVVDAHTEENFAAMMARWRRVIPEHVKKAG